MIKLNLINPYTAVHLLLPCYIISSHAELDGFSLRESSGSHFIYKRSEFPCHCILSFASDNLLLKSAMQVLPTKTVLYEGKSMSGTTTSVSLSCCRAQCHSVCLPFVSGSTLAAGAGPAPRRRCEPCICTDHNYTGWYGHICYHQYCKRKYFKS